MVNTRMKVFFFLDIDEGLSILIFAPSKTSFFFYEKPETLDATLHLLACDAEKLINF